MIAVEPVVDAVANVDAVPLRKTSRNQYDSPAFTNSLR
ncbi:hypothetical protein D805_0504 [Bifidobacterium thermophilum RBL67]|uniref:Uncharacterized protein n=1 Tax=Bifidobacterium thermophilum RBL67 TaxID=1254439 RepID=M4RBC3_9BIFI|nr:hypothetical protein D805_0504 [Bifidobacterium thermophilum RBL67]